MSTAQKQPTKALPLVIAFYTHKGGVGKTTCIHNITHVLAQEFGLKVLLVDMDPQASLTGVVMHKYFEQEGKKLSGSRSQTSRKQSAKEIVELGEESFYENREQGKRTTIYEIFKASKDENEDVSQMDQNDTDIIEDHIEDFSEGGDSSPTKKAESQPQIQRDDYNLTYIVKHWKDVVKQVEPITIPLEGEGAPEFKFIPGDLNITIIEGEITEALAISAASGKLGSFYVDMPGAICGILREVGKKEGVDVILLDLNPGAGSFNMACIMGSDYFIVPSLPDFYSRRSIKSLSKLIKRWNIACEFFREFPKDPFKFPLCPRFLGQIYNQVKVISMDFTTDQNKKIELLQREIKKRLMPYMAKDAVFLTDPPVITDFTRLIDKVEEIGIPISRARFDDIHSLVTRRNISANEVTQEAKLHLNCYFAAVVHIFSNLSSQHHRLLNNVLRLDIENVFPPADDFLEDQSFQDTHGETWEKHRDFFNSEEPPAEYNPRDIAKVLDKHALKLSNDVYNAFSLLQLEDRFSQATKISDSGSIEEKLECFKELREQLDQSKEGIYKKIQALKKTTKVFGLVWKDLPNDPQLCKISYCSSDKEERGTRKPKSNLNETRAKKIDSYFDSYIEIRCLINKINQFLTDEETRKVYFKLIQVHPTFIGEVSLRLFAGIKKLPLKIWTKDPQSKKIKPLYTTSNDPNCLNLLCETKNYSKIYTEIKKKVVQKGSAKKSSTQKQKSQETTNKNGKRTKPPREEGMETKKKSKK